MASNITSNSATLSWNGSTDNVGVASYTISIDGNVVGNSTTTTFDVTGLTALTLYSASVSAQDAAGNVSGNATTSFTTLEGGGGTPGVIAGYFFETGLEGWIDGGNDCAREATANSFEGSFSVRLRDNSNSSNMVSPALDLSGNNQVTIEFHSFANSMENGEDYFVEFFNGSSYQVIGQYVSGTDFSNGSFFTDTITLDSSTFNFNASNRFRIRCDASANNDQIWIDQVIVSGDNVSSFAAPQEAPTVTALRSFTEASKDNIKLYPNPTRSQLTIDIFDVEYDEIIIFSSTGTVVQTINPKEDTLTVDVSKLSSGMYFVRFVSKEGLAVTKRFIKQ